MVLNTEGEVIGATTEALVQRLTLHKKSSGKKNALHMSTTKKN